jgi:hypothetical protein
MASKISLEWAKNLPKEEQEDFKDYVRNSTTLVTRLREIIESYEQVIYDKESREAENYRGDWAYLQAHRNGAMEALRKVKKLTDHLT